MAPRRLNPLAFTPGPVTFITVVFYLALLIPVLVIHNVVPSAPRTSPRGLDLDQAWSDLQFLSGGFHPYNSHRNDEVHEWLLKRVNEIVHPSAEDHVSEQKPEVFVFDDNTSNLTFPVSLLGNTDSAVYFEGTNIIVYIRGEEDEQDNWWEELGREPSSKGVLVNAHYDSVSTGFGATDDGVGVVTCLQLLKYFTTSGHAPRKGLALLFNNGEEDYLNGAFVYSQHPMSKFTRTFLNLEGAGAGGRATLFRTSDTGVTRSYMNAEHPFGSVLSANGFETGLIRSQTDYVVFEKLGLRGLDVAFMEPRSRYHTDKDDARHTSMDSLWHMLSAAVATTKDLVTTEESGRGTRPVWFDVFGSTFVVFQLHTLFALSVTLLIVAPLALLLTGIALSRVDKMYLFRSSVKLEDSEEKVGLRGSRGFFRFPFLFVIPTGVSMVLAYLLTKTNPYIIHSSEYAVWIMMITAWTFLAWFVSRVADFARPSAFHRVYTLTWMFVLTWVLQVVATVFENGFGMAGGYFIFFYYAGTSLATWISYLELFSLPRKSDYAAKFIPGSRRESRQGQIEGDGNAEEEPTESTSLLRNQRTTFANYDRVTGDTDEEEEQDPNVYKDEQQWSSSMPKWTWILQFIFVAPIVLILVGPLALLATGAMHQTGQDGSSSLFIYISIAIFTTLLFSPLLPFIHRYTYHLPVFLLLIFIGTLIYNLVAFPFSESNRLKLFFIQTIDLDSSTSKASLTGIQPYLEDVITTLPSSTGKEITCTPWNDRVQCSWPGLSPRLVPNTSTSTPTDLLSLSITKTPSKPQAKITLSGKNTRACKLSFNTPLSSFTVADSASDPRFPYTDPTPLAEPTPVKNGTKELNLWSRNWDNTFSIDIEWSPQSPETETETEPLTGRATCLWSDANQEGTIPALDEIYQYAPVWVAVSKLGAGLVEAGRGFEIVDE